MPRITLTIIRRDGSTWSYTAGRLPQDVRSAYAIWKAAADDKAAARASFRAAIAKQRRSGAKLDTIAEQLGITRQAIQKILRQERATVSGQDELPPTP